jgi:pyruvate kinase
MLSEMAAGAEALDAMTERAVRACGCVRPGDLVILLVGSTTVPGATNMMKVHRVGA